MDDVVGLVMVNIVTTLGNGDIGGWPIARPIVASFGLLLATLTLAHFVLRPIWRLVAGHLTAESPNDSFGDPDTPTSVRKWLTALTHNIQHVEFILSTAALVIFVTIASFIDCSVLFAAFIAGGLVNFLSSLQEPQSPMISTSDGGPSKMYQQYYKPVMEFILVPFFFVSPYYICCYVQWPCHQSISGRSPIPGRESFYHMICGKRYRSHNTISELSTLS